MNANEQPASPNPPGHDHGNDMTLDEFVAWCQANQTQDENGMDLSHLRENLRLTPAERLRKLERALEGLAQVRPVAASARE